MAATKDLALFFIYELNGTNIMPESSETAIQIAGQDIFPGKKFYFGSLSISEKEIIEFAKVSDPLYFHIDPEAASKSHFGRIVGSGPHLFSEFHKRFWIPIFGKSVIAGLAIRNWVFLMPHYPDQSVTGELEVSGTFLKSKKDIAIVHWKYSFTDREGSLIQSAEFEVMHKLDIKCI